MGKIVVVPEELNMESLRSYRDMPTMNQTGWTKFVEQEILEKGNDAYYYNDTGIMRFFVVIKECWYEVPGKVVSAYLNWRST